MGSLRQTSAVSDRGYNRAEIDRTRSRKRLKKSRPSRLGSKLLPLQKICGRPAEKNQQYPLFVCFTLPLVHPICSQALVRRRAA